MSWASLAPDDAFEDSLSCPLFEFFEAQSSRPCDEDWEREEERACQGQLRRTLAQLLRPSSIFQAKLLRDVRQFKAQLLAEGEAESFLVVCLAAQLSTVGYRLQIRNALGGGYGPDCFRQLRHEFLVVSGEGDTAGLDLIVEPAFSAHFQIGGQGSPRYQQLLDMLPAELVAPQATLTALTQLLCAEMRTAFKLTGLTLPPWRQGSAMLSKWLPQKAHDWPPLKSFKSGSPSSPDGATSPRGIFSLSSFTTTGASPDSPDPSLLNHSPVILGFSPPAQVPAAAASPPLPDVQPQHWPAAGPVSQVHGAAAAGGEQVPSPVHQEGHLNSEGAGWPQQPQQPEQSQQPEQPQQMHRPSGTPARQLHRLSVCSSAQSPQPAPPASHSSPQGCFKPRRPIGPPGGLSALLSARRPSGLTGFEGGLVYRVTGPESPPVRTVKLQGAPVQE